MPGEYTIVSRTGTNGLTVAVHNAMDDGFIPIGGVTVHTETRGRERITTYHQALYKPE
jgi:hypothetical protein|tara:strand:+ start:147 stop:320 length:174 start_codon:yes stop_codon:yes gene_type:complete